MCYLFRKQNNSLFSTYVTVYSEWTFIINSSMRLDPNAPSNLYSIYPPKVLMLGTAKEFKEKIMQSSQVPEQSKSVMY